ncbi:hypothetical protein [Conexibacter sp. SYSU D00693]|uniref:hypothetical protein n=1 Tax=Conexibacter sp. SYSU D00693 TaxID=2812560 RepID=UPI00196B01E9|nr:hypothetical protein [Conexibacter sp. SYSU D00693]
MTSHPFRDHPDVGRTVRDAFWVVALGVIACYAFFLALGAFSPGDVLPGTIAVLVLLALWVAHSWVQRRITEDARDPRLTHARERRGF